MSLAQWFSHCLRTHELPPEDTPQSHFPDTITGFRFCALGTVNLVILRFKRVWKPYTSPGSLKLKELNQSQKKIQLSKRDILKLHPEHSEAGDKGLRKPRPCLHTHRGDTQLCSSTQYFAASTLPGILCSDLSPGAVGCLFRSSSCPRHVLKSRQRVLGTYNSTGLYPHGCPLWLLLHILKPEAFPAWGVQCLQLLQGVSHSWPHNLSGFPLHIY